MPPLRTHVASAIERRKPSIRLNLPSNSLLVESARWKCSDHGNAYAWQLRVPDPARLLGSVAPVLERRLAASSLSGITRTLRINLYRTSIDLRFEAGRLVVGEHEAAEPFSVIRMPPPLLAPLVMGY